MQKVLIAGRPEDVGNYIYAIKQSGMEPVVSLCLPTAEGYTSDVFSALLLPGGADVDPALFGQENCGSRTIERDLDTAQLDIMDIFVKSGKPILGICKGCQVINIYFKGNIIQDLENNVHHQAYQGEAVKHAALTLPGNPLYELFGGGEITINSSHHQAVDMLGEGLMVCQYSDDHVVEAIMHKTLPILGIQWHPERMSYDRHVNGEADGTLIFEYFREMTIRYSPIQPI